MFEIARASGADRVFIDSPYIDLDYRSELSHFYARAFSPPPDTAERLLFARQDEMVGAAVIRPLPQPVGRAMLQPPPDVEPYLCCRASMSVNAFGHQWSVVGFPFTSQDGEYGVCAHAAMWAIARYHQMRFGTDRHTVSGIIEAAGLRERTDRTARSEGLYALDVLRAFRGIGLPALNYSIGAIPQPETVDKVVCRYLNSGIPVGVLTNNHMVVICGYGERPDGSVFYFVSDDNSDAYVRVDHVPQPSDVNAWKMLVIPLPGRIHVSGEAAEARAEQVFEDRIRAKAGPGHLLARWQGNEIRVRTYATPAADYTNDLEARGVPAGIRDHHVYAPKAGWLWVSEFQDKEMTGGECVIGEVAIDATGLQLDPRPGFANIDGWGFIWRPGSEEPDVVPVEPGADVYVSAIGDRRERQIAGGVRPWVSGAWGDVS